jgi:mannan endo-1,4-beta-mannosidase
MASTVASPLVAGLDVAPRGEAQAISELGRTPAVLDAFFGFEGSTGRPAPFPTQWADSVIAAGSTPEVTWQPNLSTYPTQSVLASLADGSQDSYIEQWAAAAKATGHLVLVRLMHEFNGDWYPWGAVRAGVTPLPGGTGTYPYTNTPAMYVAAYQHVVNLFRQVGADNVRFVWCLSATPLPTDLSAYYPGDTYVAWPSIDGYNRSATEPASFYSIFEAPYKATAAITKEHILVAETASVEFSGLSGATRSKAAWIDDAYQTTIPDDFPKIGAVIWFDLPGTGNFTYPIDSSPATLQAIQAVFASPLYQGRLP